MAMMIMPGVGVRSVGDDDDDDDDDNDDKYMSVVPYQ